MEGYHVYTDGACSGNPGPGGWASVILDSNQTVLAETSGYQPNTTNNRMEIQAAIAGIEHVLNVAKEPHITLYSDSSYLINAYAQGWMRTWLNTGWKKGTVKNQDLWQQLNTLVAKVTIKWVKVKGHSDNFYNNRCDQLAVGEVTQHTTHRNKPASRAVALSAEPSPAASPECSQVNPITLNNPSSTKASENRCLVSLADAAINVSKIQQVAANCNYATVKSNLAPLTVSSVTASMAQATFNHSSHPIHPFFLQVGEMADFWLERNAKRAQPYPSPKRTDLVKFMCCFIATVGAVKAEQLGLRPPQSNEI